MPHCLRNAANIVRVLYVEASENLFGHVVSSVIVTLGSAAGLVALVSAVGARVIALPKEAWVLLSADIVCACLP